MRIETDNLGIMVIDMQDYFLTKRKECKILRKQAKRTIDKQVEVIRVARKKQIPMYVLVYNKCGQITERIRTVLEGYSKVEIVVKKYDNGFCETDLGERLTARDIRKQLLMGVNASDCVLATAYGGLERGIGVITSGGLIYDEKGHVPRKTTDWYRANGEYFDDYRQLLEALQ